VAGKDLKWGVCGWYQTQLKTLVIAIVKKTVWIRSERTSCRLREHEMISRLELNHHHTVITPTITIIITINITTNITASIYSSFILYWLPFKRKDDYSYSMVLK
jgi:hypothetical protein